MSLLDAAGIMNGDFFCNGAFNFDSPLKDLLDSGNYSLEQILAEDELLQEIRGMNPQLIDFLTTEEAVAGLIQYIVLAPPAKKRTTKKKSMQNGDENSEIAVAVAVTAAAAAVVVRDENTAPIDVKIDVDVNTDDENGNKSIKGQEDGAAAAAAAVSGNATESDSLSNQPENSVTVNVNVNANANANATTANEPGQWLQGAYDPEEDVNTTTRQQQQTQQQRDDNVHVRFPYMACEVICCELKGVIDIIVDGFVPLLDTSDDDDNEGNADGGRETNNNNDGSSSPPSASKLLSDEARGRPMLDLLFSVLYDSESGEMDDYRAGYFEKVLSVLLKNRPNDIAEYLNDGGGKGNSTLMSVVFKHLYSYSLMQIVQHLLMPQPPPNPEADESKDEAHNECGDLFGNAFEAANAAESFRCNWSESQTALQMVVDCLTADVRVDEGKNNSKTTNTTTTTPSTTEQIEDDENDDDDKQDEQEEEERKLNLYRNSSEVLITIIQNSPLTSRTMCALTTEPMLENLIRAAVHIEDGSQFSRHDSRLTWAMNVLESLILQLGGYGSVCTMIYSKEEDALEQEALENTLGEILGDGDKAIPEESMGESQTSNNTTTGEQQALSSTNTIENYATPETLIRHLPALLSSLSDLLVYTGVEKWVSPTQFSKKPQHILGASRLRIVRLLESLVLLGNNNVDSLLCESSCLEICLDLFWKFQWCSMMHQSVANLLVHVFEGQNARSELQSYFIVRCNLLGRLMYSFWDEEAEGGIASFVNESNTELSESIMGQKDSDSENSPTICSVLSEKGSTTIDDVLLVSDDDVDVAMEQQQDDVSFTGIEATAELKHLDETNNECEIGNNSIGDHDDVKEPSLRLGYMGHVIIICQALVHAYAEENDCNGPTVEDAHDLSEDLGGDDSQELSNQNEEVESDDYCTAADDDTPSDPLVLARLVEKDPLGKIWKDFVLTTLASATALQTTPLGGFQASTLGTDPLQTHRPGYEDVNGYDDDNGEAPALPQRGLLVDGDLIDMDDNDLEVAANMMAGLNLGQVAGNNGDNQTQSSIPRSGYVFDDPLGSGRFTDFDHHDDDDDDDSDGDSSDDGEPDMLEDARTSIEDGISSDHEAPVMDLFAGNFDANFDDAFADEQNVDSSPEEEGENNFDSIFGDVKSRDILLDEFEEPTENGIFDGAATIDEEITAGNAEAV